MMVMMLPGGGERGRDTVPGSPFPAPGGTGLRGGPSPGTCIPPPRRGGWVCGGGGCGTREAVGTWGGWWWVVEKGHPPCPVGAGGVGGGRHPLSPPPPSVPGAGVLTLAAGWGLRRGRPRWLCPATVTPHPPTPLLQGPTGVPSPWVG